MLQNLHIGVYVESWLSIRHYQSLQDQSLLYLLDIQWYVLGLLTVFDLLVCDLLVCDLLVCDLLVLDSHVFDLLSSLWYFTSINKSGMYYFPQ